MNRQMLGINEKIKERVFLAIRKVCESPESTLDDLMADLAGAWMTALIFRTIAKGGTSDDIYQTLQDYFTDLNLSADALFKQANGGEKRSSLQSLN